MKTLVVQYDADYALVISEMLRSTGHHVEVATSAEDARRIVTQTDPDVVVLDVASLASAPLDLCRWVREASPDIALVVLSDLRGSADIVAVLAAGADDYIVKPFHPTELTARVQALLRRSQLSRRGRPVLGTPAQSPSRQHVGWSQPITQSA